MCSHFLRRPASPPPPPPPSIPPLSDLLPPISLSGTLEDTVEAADIFPCDAELPSCRKSNCSAMDAYRILLTAELPDVILDGITIDGSSHRVRVSRRIGILGCQKS